jgi:LysM repeat protein
VAPAAFLLAVTVAVVLIRAGMHAGATPTTTVTRPRAKPVADRKPTRRYWTVRAGDTFAVISSRTGVPVRTIVRLNPRSSSNSLHIGQKVRIR